MTRRNGRHPEAFEARLEALLDARLDRPPGADPRDALPGNPESILSPGSGAAGPRHTEAACVGCSASDLRAGRGAGLPAHRGVADLVGRGGGELRPGVRTAPERRCRVQGGASDRIRAGLGV